MNQYTPPRELTPEPCYYCGTHPYCDEAFMGSYGAIICADCKPWLVLCVNCGHESLSPAEERCRDCELPFYVEFTHEWRWKKFPVGENRAHQRCRIVAKATGPGPRNALVEFEDGARHVVTNAAVRFGMRRIRR